MVIRLIIFLAINFGGLAIGGFFTGSGVVSDWYTGLKKAPWTPPGWFFGLAWTTIMIFYSIYLSNLWTLAENKKFFIGLFALQFLLNVTWNPIFFYYQNVNLGLLTICVLTFLIGYSLFGFWKTMQLKSMLILPYFIWLIVASSLNADILIKN